MEVRRKRSRWPSVSALVCLLLLCLAIPLYWQAGDLPAKKPAEVPRAATTHVSKHVVNEWPSTDELEGFETSSAGTTSGYSERTAAGGSDQLVLAPARPQPTVSYSAQSEPGDADLFAELMSSPVPPSPQVRTARQAESAVPGPYVTAMLRRAGYDLSRLSTDELAALAARLGHVESSQPAAGHLNGTVSMQFTSPNDRVAMKPQYPANQHGAGSNAFSCTRSKAKPIFNP